MRILLDTHVWAWSMVEVARLSRAARRAIDGASEVYVSPVSCFELCQKVRVGKWPEMEPFSMDLPRLIEQQRARVAVLTPEITASAGLMTWSHRDPFDRLIASTADGHGLILLSADPVFGTLGSIRTVW